MSIVPDAKVLATPSQRSSTNPSDRQPRPSKRGPCYERLLAIMQAAVEREASQQINWYAEWGDQSEQD